MIQLTVSQFEAMLAFYGYPFVRILSFLGTEPVLGNRTVPARVKVALALFIAFLVAPVLPDPPAVSPASAAGLIVIAQQVLIGAAMGFSARIVVAAAEMAGQLAGLQMGLGFAVFFDPQGSGQTPLVAQFYGVLAILVLLATDSHYLVLSALVESFRIVPPGVESIRAAGFLSLVSWGARIFEVGMMLALPVIGALLVANIGIGVLVRAAPQLNIFAVGFPITLAVGFLMFYVSLPIIVPILDATAQAGVAFMLQMLRQFRPLP